MSDWIQPGIGSASAAALIGTIGIAILVWRLRILRGTTLVVPCWWAVASCLAISASEIAIGLRGSSSNTNWHEAIRFAAATTIFCPIVAALGAKRPQDKAWQLIVVSLWCVLVLPAAENVLLQPDQPLEIRDSRSWFILALIAVTAVNSLPTRFWVSSIFLVVGQTVIFAQYLPVSMPTAGSAGILGGMILVVAAVAMAAVGFPPRRSVELPEDRLWLDFRDSFGTLWGLRVAERINAAATTHRWNIALSWRGFHPIDSTVTESQISPDVAKVLHKTIRGLLRRFVSAEWIASRLNQTNGLTEMHEIKQQIEN